MNRFLLTAILANVSCAQPQEEFTKARERMVQDQIIARGVEDTATLRAMRTVQRHKFVPPEWTDDAYDDSPLPIGQGQTISQPYIVAFMTESVKPTHGQRVLEIGTGSGYQAAVLAEIVDSVYTIEIVPELATSAAERLKRLGCENVIVRQGDGYLGWPEHAPFDAILVTAAVDHVPQPLVDQLKDGGVMVLPLGEVQTFQTLTLIRKQGKNIVSQTKLPVRFVPLIHKH